jgi:hypothetical protein
MSRWRKTAASRLSRWEWAAAIALTAAAAILAVVRMLHAGALWRDEAGAARLAMLPTLHEVVAMFPHEAFPPLFPLLVRTYSELVGGGDTALRAFGLAIGLLICGVLWFNARTTARTVPLLSLALLGLDVPFVVLGDSLRGYGLGSALILLTYGLLAAGIRGQPGRSAASRWLLAGAAAGAAIASVQVVLGNAALVFAVCAAAAVVAAARRRWLAAAWAMGCGAAAALSLLPYAPELAAARRQWSLIVVQPIPAMKLWQVFAGTIGPRTALVAWLLLVLGGLAGILRLLLGNGDGRRPAAPAASEGAALASGAGPPSAAAMDPEPWRRDVAAFAGLTIVGALLACGIFLETLSYTPRPWYFVPLIALVASALDSAFGVLSHGGGRRFATARMAAVALLAAAEVLPLAQHLNTRQTNADLVARAVTRAAAPADLVVVVPWFFGVSFNRYYRGPAPWVTLPEIPDHRVHRYDLLKARLADPHPLDDLLDAVAATLRSGHRVWLVGSPAWPRPEEAIAILPPAPLSPAGWRDFPYVIDWERQLGRFLQRRAILVTKVPVPVDEPVDRLENLSLTVVQGWKPPAAAEQGGDAPGAPGLPATYTGN